jgi:Spy/CpxP family protein refolding chaperone
MKRTHLITVAGALLVLMLSSAWLGATLALRWNAKRPQESPLPLPAMALLERLERLERLPSLTEEQRRRIGPALDRARSEVRTLAADSFSRASEIRRRLRGEIDDVLTPSQRAEFDRRWNQRPRFFERARGGAFSLPSTNDEARTNRNR